MKRVLVADDSEIVRGVVAMILGAAGYAVAEVARPSKLAEALRAAPPDLVLVDLTIPGLAADKIVAAAREAAPPGCAIVLYSDRPDAELARAAAALGLTDYVRKGGDPAMLVRHVARLLARAP